MILRWLINNNNNKKMEDEYNFMFEEFNEQVDKVYENDDFDLIEYDANNPNTPEPIPQPVPYEPKYHYPSHDIVEGTGSYSPVEQNVNPTLFKLHQSMNMEIEKNYPTYAEVYSKYCSRSSFTLTFKIPYGYTDRGIDAYIDYVQNYSHDIMYRILMKYPISVIDEFINDIPGYSKNNLPFRFRIFDVICVCTSPYTSSKYLHL